MDSNEDNPFHQSLDILAQAIQDGSISDAESGAEREQRILQALSTLEQGLNIPDMSGSANLPLQDIIREHGGINTLQSLLSQSGYGFSLIQSKIVLLLRLLARNPVNNLTIGGNVDLMGRLISLSYKRGKDDTEKNQDDEMRKLVIACLVNLTNFPENSTTLREHGGIHAFLSILKELIETETEGSVDVNRDVVKYSIMALTNLVRNDPTNAYFLLLPVIRGIPIFIQILRLSDKVCISKVASDNDKVALWSMVTDQVLFMLRVISTHFPDQLYDTLLDFMFGVAVGSDNGLAVIAHYLTPYVTPYVTPVVSDVTPTDVTPTPDNVLRNMISREHASSILFVLTMVSDDRCQDEYVRAGVLHALVRHVLYTANRNVTDHNVTPLPSLLLMKNTILSIWNIVIDHPINQQRLLSLDDGMSLTVLCRLFLTEMSSVDVELKQALLDLLIFLSTCPPLPDATVPVVDRITASGMIAPLVGLLIDQDVKVQYKTCQLMTLLAGSDSYSGANIIRIEGGIPLLGLVLSTRSVSVRVKAGEALAVLARQRECRDMILGQYSMSGTLVYVLKEILSGAVFAGDSDGVGEETMDDLVCVICRVMVTLLPVSDDNIEEHRKLFINEGIVTVLHGLQEKYASAENIVQVIRQAMNICK